MWPSGPWLFSLFFLAASSLQDGERALLHRSTQIKYKAIAVTATPRPKTPIVA